MQTVECCRFACRELRSMRHRKCRLSWVVWPALRPVVSQGRSQTSWRCAHIEASSTGHPNIQWQRMLSCSTSRSRPHHALAAFCRCLPLQPTTDLPASPVIHCCITVLMKYCCSAMLDEELLLNAVPPHAPSQVLSLLPFGSTGWVSSAHTDFSVDISFDCVGLESSKVPVLNFSLSF